jgi:hypothetical protein
MTEEITRFPEDIRRRLIACETEVKILREALWDILMLPHRESRYAEEVAQIVKRALQGESRL